MTQYISLVKLCVPTVPLPDIQGIFGAPLAFDAVIFSLTAFKAWTNWKKQTGTTSVPLLMIIYRGMLLHTVEKVFYRLIPYRWSDLLYAYARRSNMEYHHRVYIPGYDLEITHGCLQFATKPIYEMYEGV